MSKLVKLVVAVAFTAVTSMAVAQQVLDRVAVIVNEGVVLESEVQQLLREVKNNAANRDAQLPEDSVLRVQATDRLVMQQLQLQMASRMGITISDTQLQQTIQNIARDEGMSVDEMRGRITASGTPWDDYRESVRKEIITGEVQRAAVQRRVYISPQEISGLVNLLTEAS